VTDLAEQRAAWVREVAEFWQGPAAGRWLAAPLPDGRTPLVAARADHAGFVATYTAAAVLPKLPPSA
jgi:hypothetical protein